MPESGAQGASAVDGERDGSDSGECDAGNRRGHMNRRDAVELASVVASAPTALIIALYVFMPLPEPWRSTMGAVAVAVALLTVAVSSWNMLGRKWQDDRLDAILKGQEETNRLLKNISDELAQIRKSA